MTLSFTMFSLSTANKLQSSIRRYNAWLYAALKLHTSVTAELYSYTTNINIRRHNLHFGVSVVLSFTIVLRGKERIRNKIHRTIVRTIWPDRGRNYRHKVTKSRSQLSPTITEKSNYMFYEPWILSKATKWISAINTGVYSKVMHFPQWKHKRLPLLWKVYLPIWKNSHGPVLWCEAVIMHSKCFILWCSVDYK